MDFLCGLLYEREINVYFIEIIVIWSFSLLIFIKKSVFLSVCIVYTYVGVEGDFYFFVVFLNNISFFVVVIIKGF